MNRRQKSLIRDFIYVIVFTALAVIALLNLKDYVNRAEAMRAMGHLGKIVLGYRQAHGAVPPQLYVDQVRSDLEGGVRLGNLVYRARWIGFGATGDEILAYTKKDYHNLIFGTGYIVLRLDGRIEWMGENEFKKLLASQQSAEEKKLSTEER
jgi:hypothetical protein